MELNKTPRSIRVFLYLQRCLHRFFSFQTACFNGFWLGFLKHETLQQTPLHTYDTSGWFAGKYHNFSGLYPWETQAIQQHFPKSGSILVAAAGAGREMLALLKMGYNVDGMECSETLVQKANQYLQESGFSPTVKHVPPSTIPKTESLYDAAIFGWGTLSLIVSRQKRIECLKHLKKNLKPEAPLLISFFHHKGMSYSFKVTRAIANFIRYALGRPYITPGDYMDNAFQHHFTTEEIKEELLEAGFRMGYFNNDDFACAIAHPETPLSKPSTRSQKELPEGVTHGPN